MAEFEDNKSNINLKDIKSLYNKKKNYFHFYMKNQN